MTATVDPVTASLAAYSDRPDVYAARNADTGADLYRRFLATLPTNCRVLDAGCGPGRDLHRFATAGHRPVGVDLCPAFTDMASRYAPVVLADLRALPFATSTFQAVWGRTRFRPPPTARPRCIPCRRTGCGAPRPVRHRRAGRRSTC